MAYADGFTGDATSGIGQGLAYVLPQNNAVKYAARLAQTHASQLQDMARAKQQEQLKAQKAYEDDFKQQKLPQAFAPFDKELNTRHSKWMQDAAKQYASTGKNPFNDPEMMARYNDEVVVPARKSQELGVNYTKLRALAETDPTNKYTKESKQSVIDYQKQMETDPFSTLDKPLPQLQETPATADDLVKTLKPSGDDSFNKAQTFSALLGDPKWHNILKSYGYNPDLPDFGVYTDPKHPNGKRVWYTNDTFTSSHADDILSAPDDPRNAKILSTLQIDPKDQFAKEKLQHAITDQNAAMGKAVTEIGGRMLDPEKVQQLKDQKHTLMNQDRDYALRVQEHIDLQKERKAKFEAIPPFERVSEQIKTAAQSGDYTAAKKLADNIVEHIPAKKYREAITTKAENGTLTIHIPKEHVPSGNGAKAYDISVDMSDPNFESVLWAKLKGAGMDVNAFNQAYKGRNVPDANSQPHIKTDPKKSTLAGWNQ